MTDPSRRQGRFLGELPLLAGPPVLWLTVFFLVPVAMVMAFSFVESYRHGVSDFQFTLEHYRQALDPVYPRVLWRSIVYSAVSTAFTLLLAFPAACYIAFSPPRRQKWLLFLVFLPLWVNLLVRLYSFIVILSAGGLLNRVLQALSLTREPVQLLNTPFAVLLGFVYGNLPYMIPPIYTALERMNPALLEASMDLGAGRGTTFRRIVLPQSAAGVAAGVTLCFIPTLGSFLIPDILGGPESLMIGNLITSQFQQGRNWPFGSALSSLLVLLVMLGICLYLRGFDPTAPREGAKE